jgi:hypothetical protein
MQLTVCCRFLICGVCVGGGGEQGGKVSGTLRPCFQGHKVWDLD